MPVALGPAARPKGFRHATRLSLLPPPDCLSRAPAASELAERGLEAVRDAVEAAPRGNRGRTAVTVAAVTATALVATAAYVWWKRRDHVGAVSAPRPVTPTVVVAAAAPASAQPTPSPAVEPIAVIEPPIQSESVPTVTAKVVSMQRADDCEDVRRGIPQPSVASTASAYSRPPALSGRFAMPGVRGVVLPGSGGSLP